MLKFYSIPLFLFAGLTTSFGVAQEAGARKPLEHVIGTVSAVDPSAHTITIKDDKTSTEYTVQLGSTKTLLKVQPGAKDLHSAARISAEDLIEGDRVDVRYDKDEASTPTNVAARSVVLMSARDLQQAHQQEAAAWQHSTVGRVESSDAAAQKLSVRVSGSPSASSIRVDASKATQFTRYSPTNPKTPVASQFSDIQPGDQVRVIGAKSDDGAAITAEKIYSGAFRTITATIASVSADGKTLTVKDLQTKQPVTVTLSEDSVIRKLPAMMAAGLARRLNPGAAAGGDTAPGAARGATDAGNAGPGSRGTAPAGRPPMGAESGPPAGGPAGAAPSGATPSGAPAPGASPSGATAAGGAAGGGAHRGGDINAMLERVPTIQAADLKAGDAVVISGALGSDNSHLVATNVIAGVEPILQSASPRQRQSMGDWGTMDMAAPAQ